VQSLESISFHMVARYLTSWYTMVAVLYTH